MLITFLKASAKRTYDLYGFKFSHKKSNFREARLYDFSKVAPQNFVVAHFSHVILLKISALWRRYFFSFGVHLEGLPTRH